MLRGHQESSGWFQYHKMAATSASHDQFPSLDLHQQQVFYGVPEMRGEVRGCYSTATDLRTSSSSYSTPTDVRPYPPEQRSPPQVVNQRFIQCVNHFAPTSRSLPCLLQPSYYAYEYCPAQSCEPILPRVNYSDVTRSPVRYANTEWNSGRPNQQDQGFYRPREQQYTEPYPSRFDPTAVRKGKAFDYSDGKVNKDKVGNSLPFSCLAVEVSQEMQNIISAGGHAQSDLMDFCKFVQCFLSSPVAFTAQRNHLIREIVLSFIHVSSAYVHLSALLNTGEQSGFFWEELGSLKASLNMWESTSTSVILALRTLMNSLGNINLPDLKKQDSSEHDQDINYTAYQQSQSFKQDNANFIHSETPFLYYSLNDNNSFRLPNSCRPQNRTDFNNYNQHFEYKRKYHPCNSNNQVDNNTSFAQQKSNNLSFKAKSCNHLSLSQTNGCSTKTRVCESESDTERCNSQENKGLKNFSFNLLNPNRGKNNRSKRQQDQDKTQQMRACNEANKQESLDRVLLEGKEIRNCREDAVKDLDLEIDTGVITSPSIYTSNTLSNSEEIKSANLNFGVFGSKCSAKLDGKSFRLTNEMDKTNEIRHNRMDTPPCKDQPENQAPDLSNHAMRGLRFLNPDLNKSLDDHCEAARIQLKHKMLDILGFLQTPLTNDTHNSSIGVEQLSGVKKSIQDGLNGISYLVYKDQFNGVGEMLTAVRNLLNTTRMDFLTNLKAVKLVNEIESNFLNLFVKEFGCCGMSHVTTENYSQS